jgi:hypothetical protein
VQIFLERDDNRFAVRHDIPHNAGLIRPARAPPGPAFLYWVCLLRNSDYIVCLECRWRWAEMSLSQPALKRPVV